MTIVKNDHCPHRWIHIHNRKFHKHMGFRNLIGSRLKRTQASFHFPNCKNKILLRDILCCFFSLAGLYCFCIALKMLEFPLEYFLPMLYLFSWYLRLSVSLPQVFRKLRLQFWQANFQCTGFSTKYHDLF